VNAYLDSNFSLVEQELTQIEKDILVQAESMCHEMNTTVNVEDILKELLNIRLNVTIAQQQQEQYPSPCPYYGCRPPYQPPCWQNMPPPYMMT